MVLPLSAFTAVPNPQMLAFMGSQSFVMMEMAGEGWQYGKRRISAMSNEEFNKLTPKKLFEMQTKTLRDLIPTVEQSMKDMTPMLETIIQQYGDFVRLIIEQIPEFLDRATGSATGEGGAAAVGVIVEPWWHRIWRTFFPSLPEAEARQGGQQVRVNDVPELKKVYQRLLDKLSGGAGNSGAGSGITKDPVSPPTNVKQTEIQILHQRWARVSTQTLIIKLKEVTSEFTALAFKYNRKRDAVTKVLYDKAQQLMHDLNTYIAWRKSRGTSTGSISGGRTRLQRQIQLVEARIAQYLKHLRDGTGGSRASMSQLLANAKRHLAQLKNQSGRRF